MEKITHAEKREIMEVLQQYKISYNKIEKVRSVYKIIGEYRCYALKKLKHGKIKSKMGEAIVQHLKNKGFIFVPEYIRNKNDELYIEKGKHSYYLMEWIEGKEVNFKKQKNLIKGVQVLASFHNASMGFRDSADGIIKNNFLNTRKVHFEGGNQLISYKEDLIKKKHKNQWEKKYMTYMDYFIQEANRAKRLFKLYNYDGLIKRDQKTYGFCHESYYYQNVLVKKDENYSVIDLDSCARNIYIYDLGKFLRRMMWIQEYQWNFNIARDCIESYGTIRPINKWDIGVLLGILIFPHKYIRLGNKRLEKKKNWSENKYRRKLEKQLQCISSIKIFTKDYSNHYDIDIGKLSE